VASISHSQAASSMERVQQTDKHSRDMATRCVAVHIIMLNSWLTTGTPVPILQALSSCALHHTGGAAAHVRVFQPQWSYWAATPAISKAHVMHRYTEGGFFVGRTERFDESLVLLAYWLGFHPVSDMWYSSRKRLYGSGHPKSNDWAASDIEALRAVTDASGERLWHAAMCALYERQLAAVGNATSAQVARDVGLLQTHNARELSPEEVEAERLLKKLRHRPVAKKFVL